MQRSLIDRSRLGGRSRSTAAGRKFHCDFKRAKSWCGQTLLPTLGKSTQSAFHLQLPFFPSYTPLCSVFHFVSFLCVLLFQWLRPATATSCDGSRRPSVEIPWPSPWSPATQCAAHSQLATSAGLWSGSVGGGRSPTLSWLPAELNIRRRGRYRGVRPGRRGRTFSSPGRRRTTATEAQEAEAEGSRRRRRW